MFSEIFTVLVLAACISTCSIPAVIWSCYHEGSFKPRRTPKKIRRYGTACILVTPILWLISLVWFLLCVATGVPI